MNILQFNNLLSAITIALIIQLGCGTTINFEKQTRNVGPPADDKTLIMTAVNDFEELSIDGIDIQLDGLDPKPYTIPIPENTRLFTFVSAIPTGTPCIGLAASVGDSYMFTSAKNCKCSSSPGSDYIELGFDDSNWLDAVEYGPYGASSFCEQADYSGISRQAKWIWVGNTTVSREVAFCRCYTNLCAAANPCKNNGICQQNDKQMCQCLENWSGPLCETENIIPMAITAKENLLNLFIDGVAISPIDYPNDWQTAMTLNISAYARLIAISASNYDNNCEGILASVDGAYTLSGARWKCTATNEENWQTTAFNDQSWEPAYVVGNNTFGLEKCPAANTVKDVDPRADWIWTSDEPNRHTFIYCRGVLPACSKYPCVNGGKCNPIGTMLLCTCLPGYTGKYCEIVGALTVSMTSVYNLGGLFVDGVQKYLPNHNDYNTADSFTVNPASKVIAVFAEAIDTANSSCHGILGSIVIKNSSYNYVTNSNWQCTHQTVVGWNKVDFRDTWSPAVNLGPNGALSNCFVRNIGEISSNAQWIWTSTNDLVSFCRYNFPMCSYDPCQNNGTCVVNSNTLCNCTDGFTGQYCEIEISTLSTTYGIDGKIPECGVNGYPVIKASKLICKCYPGFKGEKCQKEIKQCRKGSCLNGGRCENLQSKFVCLCKYGFHGSKCQHRDMPARKFNR